MSTVMPVHIFFNSFIDVQLIYKRLYIFTVYNLMSLDIYICLWKPSHNQSNRHIHHFQKFSVIFTTGALHFTAEFFPMIKQIYKKNPPATWLNTGFVHCSVTQNNT